MALGALAMVGVAILFVVWAVASLICWVLFLPFKLMGLVFKGLAFLLVLPILLIVAVVAALVFGLGIFSFLLPALPLVLIALAFVWLLRREKRTVSHAR